MIAYERRGLDTPIYLVSELKGIEDLEGYAIGAADGVGIYPSSMLSGWDYDCARNSATGPSDATAALTDGLR